MPRRLKLANSNLNTSVYFSWIAVRHFIGIQDCSYPHKPGCQELHQSLSEEKVKLKPLIHSEWDHMESISCFVPLAFQVWKLNDDGGASTECHSPASGLASSQRRSPWWVSRVSEEAVWSSPKPPISWFSESLIVSALSSYNLPNVPLLFELFPKVRIGTGHFLVNITVVEYVLSL